MTAQLPLLVFSDLDGTLIDHHSYDWSPAMPALAALGSIGAGVVLASSKTAAEIDLLRRDMGLEDWPAIVENGPGCCQPVPRRRPRSCNIRRFGQPSRTCHPPCASTSPDSAT